jgi:hypothetical protein
MWTWKRARENIIIINIVIKLLMSLTETRTKLLSGSEVCPPGSLPSSHCIITDAKFLQISEICCIDSVLLMNLKWDTAVRNVFHPLFLICIVYKFVHWMVYSMALSNRHSLTHMISPYVAGSSCIYNVAFQ